MELTQGTGPLNERDIQIKRYKYACDNLLLNITCNAMYHYIYTYVYDFNNKHIKEFINHSNDSSMTRLDNNWSLITYL